MSGAGAYPAPFTVLSQRPRLSVLFTVQDITRNFDDRDHNRGRIYQTQGHVLHVDVDERGTQIKALVQGTAQKPYHVQITIGKGHLGMEIDAICSCPVGYMCKHSVAALYEAIAQESRLSERIGVAGAKRGKTSTTSAQLSPRVAKCLDFFESPDKPLDVPLSEERVVYAIILDPNTAAGLRVTPFLQHKLRDGNWGRKKQISSGQLYGLKQTGRAVTDEDLFLLGQMQNTDYYNAPLSWEAPSDLSSINYSLSRIVETGRAFYDEACLYPLSLGEAVQGKLSWHLTADQKQRSVIRPERQGLRVLGMRYPWYLDPQTMQTGPILCDKEPRLIAHFLNLPPLSQEEAKILRKRLPKATESIPAPFDITQSKNKAAQPVPRLALASHIVAGTETSRSEIRLQLSFDYNGTSVSPTDDNATFAETTDDKIILHKRNAAAEKAIIADLEKHGLHLPPVTGVTIDNGTLDQDAAPLQPQADASPWFWQDFLHKTRGKLAQEGYVVTGDLEVTSTIIRPDSEEIEASFTQDGAWWFSMDLGINIGGQRTPLLPILVGMIKQIRSADDIEYLKTTDTCYAPLPDGRTLALPAERIYTILKTLIELFDDKALDPDGKLRVSMDLTAAFLKLEAITSKRWLGEGQLRKLVEKLGDFAGIEKKPLPEGLDAKLRPYQIDGTNWLHFLGTYGLSGILADDMGLGKTIQTLAYLLALKENKKLGKPCLIVMPTSLVGNWQAEAARFTPALKILTLHGKDRASQFKNVGKYDVVLTTYPLLPRDKEQLAPIKWSLVILDEAQAIKNPAAKMTQAACALQAAQRLCLTGTPVENHLGEAWSIFTFLMPGLLGDHKSFNRHYRNPIENNSDGDRKDLLVRRLRPFILRRLKTEVAKELPPKTEIIRRVTLGDDQRDLYETVRHVMSDRVRDEIAAKGLGRSQIVILDALLKLRQTCCDPELVKIEAARKVHTSAKLDELKEMLPTLIEEGRKILLFSQFTSMLDIIKREVKELDIPFVELRGTTKDRATPIQRFQNGEVPLFLISLKAGGTGLNLTAADTVIHYDPWWNPSVENQATDRAHRIGQNKHVFVYKLIAEGTVEERILEMQQRKAKLAAALFGDKPAAAAALTQDDIKWLMGE